MKIFTSIIVALLLSVCVFAQEKSSNSVIPPSGYELTTSKETKASIRLNGESIADILLVQTSLPWKSEANTIVLNQLGYKYDIADINNLSSINLFDYPVILIVNDQTQSFYDKYATEKEQFENYVINGGSLLFFAASDGWAKGTLRANLPGNVEVVTPHYEYNNYISDINHPIVSGILSDNIPLVNYDLYNFYCSHGYFKSLPENAKTILVESHGYPTLIEYRIGKGKVIASTLTWEHAYSYTYYSKEYARKALDDVFLYMFSEGYTPSITGLEMELRIEDANPGILVNEIEGSYVDVIAKIKNNSQEIIGTGQIELLFDKAGFYDEIKIYKRNNQADLNLVEIPGDITNTQIDGIQPNESFEIVYRFKIKDDIIPDKSISIDGFDINFNTEYKVDNSSIKSNKASIRVLERLGGMIVTNRELLYKKYDANEVNSLLSKIYEISEFGNDYPCIVFYVERYSDLAKNWKQNIDYTKDVSVVNEVALDIDSKIEKWYNHQKYTLFPLPVGVAPIYLAIIGGDEIIPFYRVNNTDYESKEQEKIGVSNNGPIKEAYDNNFFLTDNVYADTDHSFSDAEKGNLELGVGRIIGHTANNMLKFIEHSQSGPKKLETSLVATLGPNDNMEVDDVISALEDNGSTIIGTESPDLIGNDNWTEAQFYGELKKDFQVLNYMAHANVAILGMGNGAKNYLYTDEMKKNELTNFNTNNPFVSLMACHSGVAANENGNSNLPEADDCIPYKLVDLGISGLLAPTGLGYYGASSFLSQYGEKLVNQFYDGAFGDNTGSSQLGLALKNAKKEYDIALIFGKGMDQKTMLEFVYYGLPWTTIKNSATGKSPQLKSPEINDYAFDTINFSVTDYAFTDFESFEILEIPNCNYLSEVERPIIPYLTKSIILPKGSVVNNIIINKQDSVNLGPHNFPQIVSASMQDPVEYNSDYKFNKYPDIRFSYKLVEYDDYDKLIVNYIPVTINGATKEVVLYTQTQLSVDVALANTVIIKNFTCEKKTYGVNDTINFSAELINIGDTTGHFSLSISINDKVTNDYQIVIDNDNSAIIQMPWFGIDSIGHFEAYLTVKNTNDSIVGGAMTELNVLSGKILGFNFPDTIFRNRVSKTYLNFRNFKEEPVASTSQVKIYKNNENVLNLITQLQDIGENSIGQFTWDWKTIELTPGNYVAKAVVETSDGSFGPIEKQFYVEKSIVLESILPDVNEIHLCSVTNLELKVILKIGEQPKYQWYHNDMMMEYFTDSILNIPDFIPENEGEYYCKIYNEIDTVYTDKILVLKEYTYQKINEINICKGESYLAAGELQSEAGLYIDNLTDVFGCDSIITTNLFVIELPQIYLGADTTIYIGDTIILSAQEGFNSYLWNTGADSMSIVVTGLDIGQYEYYVKVTNENNCSSIDSIKVNVELANAIKVVFDNRNILVYPNPTNDKIYLQTDFDITAAINVSILDLSGKIVYSKLLQKMISNQKVEIDISALKSGTYMLKLNNSKLIKLMKVIKQ